MIVKIYRNQPELRVRLSLPRGLGPPPDGRELRLVVRAPLPTGRVWLTRIVRHGDWPGNPPENDRPPLHELPALVYPCFETEADGTAVFRFDRHLWGRPPGRYEGEVNLRERTLAKLDLDLWPEDWRMTGAGLRHALRED
jgi:hypothetical protein